MSGVRVPYIHVKLHRLLQTISRQYKELDSARTKLQASKDMDTTEIRIGCFSIAHKHPAQQNVKTTLSVGKYLKSHFCC